MRTHSWHAFCHRPATCCPALQIPMPWSAYCAWLTVRGLPCSTVADQTCSTVADSDLCKLCKAKDRYGAAAPCYRHATAAHCRRVCTHLTALPTACMRSCDARCVVQASAAPSTVPTTRARGRSFSRATRLIRMAGSPHAGAQTPRANPGLTLPSPALTSPANEPLCGKGAADEGGPPRLDLHRPSLQLHQPPAFRAAPAPWLREGA